jgi:hypothetical protein
MAGHDRNWQRLLDDYAAARTKFEAVEAATTGRFRALGGDVPAPTPAEVDQAETARNELGDIRQRCYEYLRKQSGG